MTVAPDLSEHAGRHDWPNTPVQGAPMYRPHVDASPLGRQQGSGVVGEAVHHRRGPMP
jgi:hypothetical protein